MAADVKEGFLCPICMADMGDVIQLQMHFDENHTSEGDTDFVQNLKCFFGKAKRKLMDSDKEESNEDYYSSELSSIAPTLLYDDEPEYYHPVSGIHKTIVEPNCLQATDHYPFFQIERAKRADMRAMDTNKHILRLERLMAALPLDPVKRRAHEQSVVSWLPEEDVKLCPTCAKSFNLTRRKHHCRLCGAIMCADCSTYVSFDLANRLVNPATIAQYNPKEAEGKSSMNGMSTKKGTDHLASHLGGLTVFSEGHSPFRSCLFCRKVLENRDARIRMATLPPSQMVLLYNQLQTFMREGGKMSDDYKTLATSLNRGDGEGEQLAEAKILRLQLLKLAELVDATSKKIASLEDGHLPGVIKTLQARIRICAVNFVKETLVGLPTVLSEEQLKEMKEKRKEETAKKIEEEKMKAQEAKLRYSHQKNSLLVFGDSKKRLAPSTSAIQLGDTVKSQISSAIEGFGLMSAGQIKPKSSRSPVTFGTGFMATASTSVGHEDGHAMDPLVQQMNNLRHYIGQARAAGQLDDAILLEQNLRDLQEEFQRIEEERRELEENYTTFKSVFHSQPIIKAHPEQVFDESNPSSEQKTPYQQKDSVNEDNLFDGGDDYDASGKNPFCS